MRYVDSRFTYLLTFTYYVCVCVHTLSSETWRMINLDNSLYDSRHINTGLSLCCRIVSC